MEIGVFCHGSLRASVFHSYVMPRAASTSIFSHEDEISYDKMRFEATSMGPSSIIHPHHPLIRRLFLRSAHEQI